MSKKFYHLLILDKSGSMTTIREAAVSGVNETVGTIRRIKKDTETPQNVTLTTFCGCSTDSIWDNIEVDNIPALTLADYSPCCMTPLYDAIGKACTALKKHIGADKEAIVSVTIITDGYENASREWTGASIKSLIDSLKAEGWMFAFIGANIDVEKVSQTMSIDNAMSFSADVDGTRQMFDKMSSSRSRWSKLRMKCDSPEAIEAANSDFFGED